MNATTATLLATILLLAACDKKAPSGDPTEPPYKSETLGVAQSIGGVGPAAPDPAASAASGR